MKRHSYKPPRGSSSRRAATHAHGGSGGEYSADHYAGYEHRNPVSEPPSANNALSKHHGFDLRATEDGELRDHEVMRMEEELKSQRQGKEVAQLHRELSKVRSKSKVV
eukprot:CAMPEP_0172319052 /NCGR_PEP_ID=MMETSP1058-20130122/36631_1 /TAXON_ID=83371 /ORGANISM="Detonula confervacea, Strain CCMP 353" /LENGTH=107 /DNA_ID=CAMNT_0013033997 /DNA_START=44 /DNA_END=364 /DNA_ORIENTATION=-